MDVQKRMRTAWERTATLLRQRPATAVGTSTTTVRLTDGFRATVEDGHWRLSADQPVSFGGEDSGPDPGCYGRTALGLCAAQGYALALARHGLTHRGIEVRVEGDYDVRGFFDLAADVPMGYVAMRCLVTIVTDAPEAAILAALDEADRHSPWRHNLTTAIPVTRHQTLQRSALPA